MERNKGGNKISRSKLQYFTGLETTATLPQASAIAGGRDDNVTCAEENKRMSICNNSHIWRQRKEAD